MSPSLLLLILRSCFLLLELPCLLRPCFLSIYPSLLLLTSCFVRVDTCCWSSLLTRSPCCRQGSAVIYIYIHTYMHTYNGIYNRPYDLIAETMHLKRGSCSPISGKFILRITTQNQPVYGDLMGYHRRYHKQYDMWLSKKEDLHRQCVTMFMKKWWSTSDIEVNITKHIRMLEHVWGLTS
jgi:hypothetical protein